MFLAGWNKSTPPSIIDACLWMMSWNLLVFHIKLSKTSLSIDIFLLCQLSGATPVSTSTQSVCVCFVLFLFKVSQQAAKCIPSMVCPELTEQIRREIAASLHQRKGDFACYFLTDLVTFTLPAGTHNTFMIHYSYVSFRMCNPTHSLFMPKWM